MGNKAKDLFNAFLGINKTVKLYEEKIVTKDLREMVRELLRLSTRDWILYAFSREPLEGKIPVEERINMGYLAGKCGANEAIYAMGRSYIEFANSLGCEIKTVNMPNGGENVTFAQYEENGCITVFMDTVKKAEPVIKELRDLLGDVNIFNVLLLHELFHGIEQKKSDTIYTQTKKIELWRKPFSNLSKISCLSEIAAMSFAKSVLNLDYSPYIFDVILMYLYNKEAATMLFDEIMEIKEAA